MTVQDGLWSVAMGVAAHRSIDLGRPVDLAEVLDINDKENAMRSHINGNDRCERVSASERVVGSCAGSKWRGRGTP